MRAKSAIKHFLIGCLLLPSLAFAGAASTKYPLVMVGGAAAFDTVDLGIIEIDYWYGISKKLRDKGADVLVTSLSSSDDNQKRCNELIDDVLAILNGVRDGVGKVNLVAHSQGALAARCAASTLGPEHVASVTTFAGMNRGTHISPWARQFVTDLGLQSGGFLEGVAEAALSGIFYFFFDADFVNGQDGDYDSPARSMQSFLALEAATHPDNVQKFNNTYPEGLPDQNCMTINGGRRGDVSVSDNTVVNGIRYYSYGANAGASLTNWAEWFDPIWLALAQPLNWLIVKPNDADYKWDGLVPQCGHKLGYFAGSFKMSHFDAIGHFMGIRPGFVDDLYVSQANRLKNQGL